MGASEREIKLKIEKKIFDLGGHWWPIVKFLHGEKG